MAVGYSIGFTSKAVNSTSRTFSASLSGSALLKEPTDYRNPVIQVSGNPGIYNYMQLGDYYYWVDRVVSFPDGIIEVHGHLDPLATYQDDIANTKAFCTFHSTARSPLVDDPRLQPEIVSRTDGTAADIFDSTATPTGGSVIVTTFEAGSGGNHQGVKTYAMSLTTFTGMLMNLQTSLYDNIYNTNNVNSAVSSNLANWTDPDQVFNMIGALGTVAIHDIVKALSDMVSRIGGFGSWRDNLIRAIYVPFDVNDIPAADSDQNVHLGYLNTGVSAKPVDPVYVKTKSGKVDVPWDGKVSTYPFLRNSRFTQFQVICCGGQYSTFSSDLIKDLAYNAEIGWYSAIDLCSGDWSCVLTAVEGSNKMRLASFGGNLGIDIAGLAGKGGLGMGMNYTMAGFNMAASAMSFGAINAGTGTADSVLNIGSGIASQYIHSNAGNAPSGVTGNGISSVFLDGTSGYNNIHIEGICTYPAMLDDSSAYAAFGTRYGYPSNQYKQLSLDGSYVVCSGAFVECKGNQQDQAYINSVCNSGILLES